MGVTVCTATFGDAEWTKLARTRAWPSVVAEKAPWVHSHGLTLHEARNKCLNSVETEWVVFLDADDELEPGYLDAMRNGTADVRGPVARYVQPDGRARLWQPRVSGHTHDCTADCLAAGNWLLIGSMVRTQLLKDIGGWRDFAWSEDWDTWLRCWKAGATFELIPQAVYRAHVNPQSRNRGASQQDRDAAHEAIYAANFPQAA